MGRAPDYIFCGDFDRCTPHPITGAVHFGTDVTWIGQMVIYRASTANSAAPVITPDVLRQVAAAYNEQRGSAPVPLVLGIPKIDDPAYGWVAMLEAEGDTLSADFGSVLPEVAKALRSGQRGQIDVDFFPPTNPANPVPGQWSLRRVTVFGLDDLKLPPLPAPTVTPQDRPRPSAASKLIRPEPSKPIIPATGVKDATPGPVFDGLNIPRGFDADPEQADLYARILRIQREKTVSFSEAVTIAAKGT